MAKTGRNDAPTAEPNHSGLEARIADAVTPALETLGFELVRVLVLGRDRPTVQVMADRADGAMINVNDCETITHAISAILDVDDPLPGAWNLEVSSAGIDRPLTRVKDWVRFAGHQARAEMVAPVDGRRRFTGIIIGADDTAARLRLDDGTDVALPLADLRRAKLMLTDALIAATAADAQIAATAADAQIAATAADAQIAATAAETHATAVPTSTQILPN